MSGFSQPSESDISIILKHAEWLISIGEPLSKEDRMICDLASEVRKLRGALSLGQENCDAIYDDLRERAQKAEAENASLRSENKRLNELITEYQNQALEDGHC